MAVTIKQIAELAQVSRGTVDRALNNRPGVNAEVAKRIRKIAEDLGYHPDMAARSLASKRYVQKKIGILIASDDNPFFKDVLIGIENAVQELKRLGIESSLVTIKGFDIESQLKKIDELVYAGINGLVITPVNAKEIADKLEKVIEKGIEVVTINTDIPNVKKMAYIGCDYVTSGCVAGELIGMMSNGLPERMVVVLGSRKVLAHDQRLKGIRRTIKQDFPNVSIVKVLENEENDDKCYEMVKDILKKKKDITCICFAAAGVEGGLKAIKEAGLEKKLHIVSYDLTDIIKKNMAEGIISATVCQEPYLQGYQGVNIMGKYLLTGQKPEITNIKTHVYIATKYNI